MSELFGRSMGELGMGRALGEGVSSAAGSAAGAEAGKAFGPLGALIGGGLGALANGLQSKPRSMLQSDVSAPQFPAAYQPQPVQGGPASLPNLNLGGQQSYMDLLKMLNSGGN